MHRAASISLEEKDSFSKNTLYSSDTMKTNVNKHFFLHWVTAFQGFLVESHYVDVQVFIWVLSSVAELSKDILAFQVLRPIACYTYFYVDVPSVCPVC